VTSAPPPGADSEDPLVALCHHRWAVPILALCAGEPGGGAKFVTFAVRLGLSRQTLARTLEALIAQGLLARATGVHHALRPEYVLTRAGASVAGACRVTLRELRRLGAEEAGLNKWTIPIVAALAERPRRAARFGELHSALPGATPRALAAALRDGQGAGLLSREVLDTYPPAAEYRVAKAAGRLAAAVNRLAAELGLRPRRRRGADDGGFRLRMTA
ncbi:MAG TPA: winged helix-turn-helix transcriptional regulator, partial [Phycisphaerales bacterium]|nr:winged helix-turn-helix transcriptional regulator [Phycisphaerales bacterium]